MRLIIEIILVAALIAFAWEKSLKERAAEIPWLRDKISTDAEAPSKNRARLQPFVTPAPTTSAAWMWDPNRKGPLDPPSNKHATATPH